MSKISETLRKTIEEIYELADSNFYNKLYACKELLCKKIFHNGSIKKGIDVAVIPEILPVIMKFLDSENHVFQQEGALMTTAIICTPNTKYHTKLVIDADVITMLIRLLSSRDPYVLDQSLNCICNISEHFPDVVIQSEVLLSLNTCFESENDIVAYQIARFMDILTINCQENIHVIIRAGVMKSLFQMLELQNDDICIKALNSVINIITSCNSEICLQLFDYDALSSLEVIWHRFTDTKTGKGKKLNVTKEEVVIKLLIILEKVLSKGEAALIDIIINRNFLPEILKHIYGAVTTQKIKLRCIKLIENIVTVKPNFVPRLINDYNLVYILYNYHQSTHIDQLEAVLSALKSIIEICDDKELCLKKLKECGNLCKLKNLHGHSNEKVVELSKFIFDFINPRSSEEREIIDLTLNDMVGDVDATQARQQLRRPTSAHVAERSNTRSKRSRTGTVQTDFDRLSSGGGEIDQYHDFDDYPRNGSPIVSTNEESTRNEIKHSTNSTPVSPIIFTLPDEMIAAPQNILSHDHLGSTAAENAITDNENIVFEQVKYWRPHESYIHEYCELLGAKFNRSDYDAFIVKIKFSQITSTSKPALVLPTNEKSGFGCISICLTGNEESTKAIRKKINQKFVFNQTDNFDEERITEVIGQPFMLKDEHLETIAAWFKCRIMVYCSNRYWKRFGDWDSVADDRNIPVFVFEKKVVCGATVFRIILSLKED